MAEKTKLLIHYHNPDYSHYYTNNLIKIKENLNRCIGQTTEDFDAHLKKVGYLFSFSVVGRFICYLEINPVENINNMHFFDVKDDDIKAMELYTNCKITSQTFEKRFMEYYNSVKNKERIDDIDLTMDVTDLN